MVTWNFLSTGVCTVFLTLQILFPMEVETSIEVDIYPIEVDNGFESVVGFSCIFSWDSLL